MKTKPRSGLLSYAWRFWRGQERRQKTRRYGICSFHSSEMHVSAGLAACWLRLGCWIKSNVQEMPSRVGSEKSLLSLKKNCAMDGSKEVGKIRGWFPERPVVVTDSYGGNIWYWWCWWWLVVLGRPRFRLFVFFLGLGMLRWNPVTAIIKDPDLFYVYFVHHHAWILSEYCFACWVELRNLRSSLYISRSVSLKKMWFSDLSISSIIFSRFY